MPVHCENVFQSVIENKVKVKLAVFSLHTSILIIIQTSSKNDNKQKGLHQQQKPYLGLS